MRGCIDPIDHRVSHGFIGIVYTNLCTNAPAQSLRRRCLHIREARQAVFYRCIALLRRRTMPSLVSHLRKFFVLFTGAGARNIGRNRVVRIVCVSFPSLDHQNSIIVEVSEMIRRMRDRVSLDSNMTKVFQDRSLKLGLQEYRCEDERALRVRIYALSPWWDWCRQSEL